MSITNRGFLRVAIDFFLKIHYLALFYAFIMVPLGVIGGFIGMYITYPFILPAILVPIGPLSICVHGMYPPYGLYSLLSHPYLNPLHAIAVVVALKCIVYMFLRGRRLHKYSAILLLLAVAFTMGAIVLVALVLVYSAYFLYWEHFIAFIRSYLSITILMDLTVLSYVKYKDVVCGKASRVWMPVLVFLWSFLIWLPAIVDAGEWLYWMKSMFYPMPPIVVIALWIALTVLQLVVALEYYVLSRRSRILLH